MSAWAPIAGTAVEQLAGVTPGVARLFVLGPVPIEPAAWAADLPDGWSAAPGGHHLRVGDRVWPVWHFLRAGGPPLDVYHAGVWFGDATDPERCRLALAVVGELVADAFDGGQVLATPATTGRDLFERSILDERQWPVLSLDAQELIRSTSGQGRIELFDHHGGPMLGLVTVDARLAYAALCRQLPAGVPSYDHGDSYEGMARARYRIVGTVPAGWHGPGLFGVHAGDAWQYPREPGEPFDCWVDGAELHVLDVLALHEWRPRIVERLIWPNYIYRGPLDTWAERLIRVRDAIAHRDAVGAVEPGVAELAQGAVRAIILHAIGAFHGRAHTRTRSGSTPPAGARNIRLEGSQVVWETGSTQAMPELAHPEWAAAIWARARSRLLHAPTGQRGTAAGMLHVPFGQVVGCHTDAIWLTADPRWPDDGRAGRFRVKNHVPGPVPAPRTMTELHQLAGGR